MNNIEVFLSQLPPQAISNKVLFCIMIVFYALLIGIIAHRIVGGIKRKRYGYWEKDIFHSTVLEAIWSYTLNLVATFAIVTPLVLCVNYAPMPMLIYVSIGLILSAILGGGFILAILGIAHLILSLCFPNTMAIISIIAFILTALWVAEGDF